MPLPAGALGGPGPPSPQGHLGLTTDPTEGTTGANTPKEMAHLHAGFPTFLSSLFPAWAWEVAPFPSSLLLDLLCLPAAQSCAHGGPAFSWALGEGRP